MSRVAKGLIKIIIEIIVVTILVTSINIRLNGMYLLGLPDFDEIQSVRISYPNITNEVKEFSDDYNIELALKLTGFLKYDLFEKTENIENTSEPLITITYHLKDGTMKEISANNTVVWWKGKKYIIKDKDMFVNLTEGIFFLEDIQ